MIVYKTTNLLNGKIYVGKDCNDNPKYLGSGRAFVLALEKYGKENFKKETLEKCDLSNILEREEYWIQHLDATNKDIGYNILKVNFSKHMIGPLHPHYGKHVNVGEKNGMYGMRGFLSPAAGKHLSEETKKKRNATFYKNIELHPELHEKWSKAHRNQVGPLKGKHHTEEAKLRMRLAKLGKKRSPEAIEKTVRWLRGRKRSPESIRKAQESFRKTILKRKEGKIKG